MTIGGAPATDVSVDSATQITATTPAGTGTAAVVVTNPDGQESEPYDGFTYVPLPSPPVVTGISPGDGPEAGGTVVTITGENFVDGATVTIGGAPATDVSVDSATQITATTPAGTGTAVVVVTNPDGQESEPYDGFTYVPPADNVFFMSLAPGLNMVSLPLKPVEPYTARSFAEKIGATVVIRYDETLRKFVGFELNAPDDGFLIEGGKGYIVNVPDGGTVEFIGTAWTNGLPVAAAPSIAQSNGTWAFVVSGSILDGHAMGVEDGIYTIIMKNLRTGATATETVDSGRYFAAAYADLNRNPVIELGDRVEIAVMESDGITVSGPHVQEVTLQEIRDAVVNVRLKLGDIIPSKSALLQNYPNPFNPETWIPYQLRDQASVVIRIHTTTGQLVRTLDLGYRDAGVYASRSRAAYWDGKNEVGEEIASGLYFYSIVAGDYSAIRRMVVRR